MKARRLSMLAAAATLVVTGNASAILHITNPDQVIVITHEYSGSETNFGGGFGADFGDGAIGDNGSFRYENTQPRVISCTTDSDGICRMPTGNIIGSRWPGEVIYASEIVQGFQMGPSFGSLVRSADSGIYAPVPPAQSPDPAKCIAQICDVARKAHEDNNAIQYTKVKGATTVLKWSVAITAGLVGAKLGGWVGASAGGSGAYTLMKEANTDMLDALQQAMNVAVAKAYDACKKKCGGG